MKKSCSSFLVASRGLGHGQVWPIGRGHWREGGPVKCTKQLTSELLERDGQDNALCPACHEPIGKESGQWAKHLEVERAKLREAIQSLKKKGANHLEGANGKTAIGIGKVSLEGDSSDHNSAGKEYGNQAERAKPGEAEGEEEEEKLLERIRQNQRKRVEAKLKGHFYLASEWLCNLVGANANADGNKLGGRSANGHLHGNGRSQHCPGLNNEEELHVAMADQRIGKNCDGFGQEREEEAEKMPMKVEQKCHICENCPDFLVLEVHSKQLQCLGCFQQKPKREAASQNGPTALLDLQKTEMPHCNGFSSQLGTGSGSRKRVSPAFSALHLANAPNSPEQKRAKLQEMGTATE